MDAKLLTASLVVLGGPPASGQTIPTYLPTRDVAVTYHVGSPQGGAQDLQAAWSSRLGRGRIEVGPVVLLVDAQARTAKLVMEQAGVVLDLPSANVDAYLPGAGTTFVRGDAGMVAGLRCTNWRAQSARGSGTACLTDDGVLLRGTGLDRNGHGGTIEATSVTYGAQPPALFQPPAAAARR